MEEQRVVVSAGPVEAARALAPLIREHTQAIEAERRLPEPVVHALIEAGLFKLFVPKSLGGAEADPVTFTRVVEELSKADGAVGWCVTLAGSYGLFGGLLPEEAAREIFTDPGAIVAGSLRPQGVARVVEAGYRVSGQWPFGSGIGHSTWVIGPCRIFDGDAPRLTLSGAPVTRLFFFPQAEAEILDTWHVTGLRGTGSHDYRVEDVFVPAHRACTLIDTPVEPGPIYTLPLITISPVTMVAVALGIARHAIDTLLELAAVKTPGRSQSLLRDNAQAQTEIGEAEGLLRSGRAFAYETMRDVWETTLREGRISLEQRALLWLAGTQAASQALQVVDMMYRVGGASSLYTSLPLERCLRDIRAATQHHCVTPSNFEFAGQYFLGHDVNGTIWGRDYRGDA
jgi:alkylation response protein AidB-like acyl-CoA dehydrogenase